jgi:hypothetical protein
MFNLAHGQSQIVTPKDRHFIVKTGRKLKVEVQVLTDEPTLIRGMAHEVILKPNFKVVRTGRTFKVNPPTLLAGKQIKTFDVWIPGRKNPGGLFVLVSFQPVLEPAEDGKLKFVAGLGYIIGISFTKKYKPKFYFDAELNGNKVTSTLTNKSAVILEGYLSYVTESPSTLDRVLHIFVPPYETRQFKTSWDAAANYDGVACDLSSVNSIRAKRIVGR